MGKLFTTRFKIIIVTIFALSTALTYVLLTRAPSPTPPAINPDAAIDIALGHAVNGAYDKSFPILKQLADQDITRAKLYLAVAYYHGHGVKRDRQQAKSIFMELRDKDYEGGIVNTYLNLIGSMEIQ